MDSRDTEEVTAIEFISQLDKAVMGKDESYFWPGWLDEGCVTICISYWYENRRYKYKSRFRIKDKFHFKYVEFEMPVGYQDEIVYYIVVFKCLHLGLKIWQCRAESQE